MNSGISSTTNQEGYFSISSDLGDTLVFKSIQFEQQILIVDENHLQTTLVIELKKIVNLLDEVNISSSSEEFNVKTANRELKKTIQTDLEKNWFIYYPPNPKGNLLASIIPGNKKSVPKKSEIRIIRLNDYVELFASDDTLNCEYLKNSFGIPENGCNIFLDYLESKSLNYELLGPTRRLDLIQKIYEASQEYIVILESK
ncbi:hypothetical protein [Gramella sp. Hel_I_59]|uniref:hypothetical protein n=1 Tax=Gramella sp. Hel_I_59 TaxID=1249978 RepID=UPI0011504615|nr:hypothetical protein [Gramella sp. Hel_I_59]